MELLINQILKLGGKRENLEAKVFGGGNVLQGFMLSLTAKAGGEGKLFGSVTSSDVARGIEDQLGESVELAIVHQVVIRKVSYRIPCDEVPHETRDESQLNVA